jgi:hypothetical protein
MAFAVDQQMLVARSDQRTAGGEHVAIRRFDDLDIASSIQTSGQRSCEFGGHMLDNGDRGRVLGQSTQLRHFAPDLSLSGRWRGQ